MATFTMRAGCLMACSEKLTKSLLCRLYLEEGKSQAAIAKELGCTDGWVSRKMKEYGIPKRRGIEHYRRLVGRKFGSLTITAAVGIDQNRHPIVECLCDCGKSLEVMGYSVVSGNTRSCGCNSRRRGKEHGLFKGYEDIPSVYWIGVKNGAASRGFEMDVTIEHAWELYERQGRKCAITGVPIWFKPWRKSLNLTTASFDRIDSSRGYVRGNCQWVHKRINRMKMDLTEDEFVLWCHRVASNRPLPEIAATGTVDD